MFQKDKWPFIPGCLSEIIDRDTLSVIQAGCSARIGSPLTIHDAGLQDGNLERIDPINLLEQFTPFCKLLRDKQLVQGGNVACEKCDADVALAATRDQSVVQFKSYLCHMGVQDARCVVRVHGHPIGVLFAGQFRPEQGIAQIQDNVRLLGSGRFVHMIPQCEEVRDQLISASVELKPAPVDFRERLLREAEHIERIAEAEYQRRKNNWEQEFLEELRAARGFVETTDLEQIQVLATNLLEKVRRFCRCEYIVFFVNRQEHDTVLLPIAHAGIPPGLQQNLPHFNWKKAGLSLHQVGMVQGDSLTGLAVLQRGIRGDNADHFASVKCILSFTLGNAYRAVIIYGAFAEPIQYANEQAFLYQIGRIIGWFVHTEIQLLNLRNKQKQYEAITKLLTHQLRTALTPITTYVDTAKILIKKPLLDANMKLIHSSLTGAHALCRRLGIAIRETVHSVALLVEVDDLKLEKYPLSVLVTNCAEGYAREAEDEQKQIIIENSVEYLPYAEIDIARLTIVMSNLLDNAVKYSFPGTKIYLRAGRRINETFDLANAWLEIQNDGEEIPAEKRSRVFEHGERGLSGAKLRRIPGTGIGLWEARAVIEAHGGKIDLDCIPTPNFYRQDRIWRVTFTLKIPLHQVHS